MAAERMPGLEQRMVEIAGGIRPSPIRSMTRGLSSSPEAAASFTE
jgi:hypothetical protein